MGSHSARHPEVTNFPFALDRERRQCIARFVSFTRFGALIPLRIRSRTPSRPGRAAVARFVSPSETHSLELEVLDPPAPLPKDRLESRRSAADRPDTISRAATPTLARTRDAKDRSPSRREQLCAEARSAARQLPGPFGPDRATSRRRLLLP
jgi:hypothetical protein